MATHFLPTAGKSGPSPKQPPNSLEAEQSVLGGLLLNNRAWDELVDLIREEDFYTEDHRLLWRGMGDLLNHGRPCDFVTLSEHLRGLGTLDQAGGLAYIGMLATDTPSAANILAYAQIVRERSLLRSLITTGQDVADLGFNAEGREPMLLVDEAEQKVMQIRERGQRSANQALDMPVLMDKVRERINRLQNDPDSLAGTPTGFSKFDELTTGLHAGDLMIVAGRPGMGKTSFAMNVAEHVAIMRKIPVAVFSMEMPAEQLALRVLSSFGRIDQQTLRSGHLDDLSWSRLFSAESMLREAPLYIDETGALTPQDLRARARRIKQRHGLGLIVVDYIQLMQGNRNTENRVNEISEISRSLKALAKELSVPVIALSQLSRGVESRDNKRPRMSDLRESGGIEQDADLICFVYRDEYYNKESRDRGIAEIIIAKQRNGPTGVVKTAFLGSYTRFDNLAPDYDYGTEGR